MTMTMRSDFGGVLWPPQLLDYLMNKLLTGSPFADSLTKMPTSNGSVAFPITAPGQGIWLNEGEAIPSVQLNGETDIVGVCKLASLHWVSNEALGDTQFPLAAQIGKVLSDSDGPALDLGLLYGSGAPAPDGVVAKSPLAAPGADLRESAINAWGELLASGAEPSSVRVFCHPVPLATELARVGTDGQPIHPNGGTLTLGPVTAVPVPSLSVGHVLAVDVSSVYFVVREALSFEMSPYGDGAWTHDSQSVRVKLRAAVAAPLPEKSLRLCQVTALPFVVDTTVENAATPPSAGYVTATTGERTTTTASAPTKPPGPAKK